MTVENENYVHACFLRRCGQIEGCKDARLPVYDTDAEGNVIEMVGVDGAKLVLDSIWEQISHEKCAQFCAGYCLSRFNCDVKQTYCYPVPVAGKRPNKLVAVMFAWYCADVAENAYARSAYAAAYAADAAAAARYAARYAANAADAARYADAAYHAAYAADAARDAFYLDASREIEKLVAAWGTPIKKDSEQP